MCSFPIVFYDEGKPLKGEYEISRPEVPEVKDCHAAFEGEFGNYSAVMTFEVQFFPPFKTGHSVVIGNFRLPSAEITEDFEDA